MKRSRLDVLEPVFVAEIPLVGDLEHGKLYLCLGYRAVVHLCACGCGAKVSTPLHPTGWQLTFDGLAVSLSPSVGNWSERCMSHYVIRRNRVVWGARLPRRRIEQIRAQRFQELDEHYGVDREPVAVKERGRWSKFVDRLLRR